MKERPILFSGEMVRAILDGRKTQTRRLMNPQPDTSTPGYWAWSPRKGVSHGPRSAALDSPFGQPGDRLWVKETWYCDHAFAGQSGDVNDWKRETYYRADYDTDAAWTSMWEAEVPGWRPSIFMPRWASRLTLEVTGVRVERLQDISEEDALAEGVIANIDGAVADVAISDSAVTAYAHLWDWLNCERAPWKSNPWVWVVSFRKVD